MNKINVTVWNEYGEEQKDKAVAGIYPNGLHVTISEFLNKDGGINAKTAVFSEPEHGLTDAVLDNTDVLIWWGHMYHEKLDDRIASRVVEAGTTGHGNYLSSFRAQIKTFYAPAWNKRLFKLEGSARKKPRVDMYAVSPYRKGSPGTICT